MGSAAGPASELDAPGWHLAGDATRIGREQQLRYLIENQANPDRRQQRGNPCRALQRAQGNAFDRHAEKSASDADEEQAQRQRRAEVDEAKPSRSEERRVGKGG